MLSKRAIVDTLAPGERHDVLAGLLALVCVHNARGPMGLFGDRPAVLVTLALGVLLVLAVTLRTVIRRSAAAQVGYGLVAGGALGNVVDRAIHGYVVDFIALPGFWVFNIGDACITGGLVLVALPSLYARA